MNVIHHAGDVGKAFVGQQGAIDRADRAGEFRVFGSRLHHPAVVNIHILVPVVGHAAGDHLVGGLTHGGFGDVRVMDVPTVPAHGRGQRQGVARDDGKFPLRFAPGVTGEERYLICSRAVNRTGDDAAGGIQSQPCGETFRAENYGTVAGAGNAIEKGRAGVYAIHFGAVEARFARCRRGEQHGFFGGSKVLHGFRCSPVVFKGGVGPIGVIVVDAGAGVGHDEFKMLDAAEFYVAVTGLIA